MLQLLASHLKVQPDPFINGPRKPRIWVDIGAGTGWNIEKMLAFHSYFFYVWI